MEALQTAISHWEDALEKVEEEERKTDVSSLNLVNPATKMFRNACKRKGNHDVEKGTILLGTNCFES